ncbi:hypothetical protein HPB50_026096 [Hyalomma asiaticum]|uniref:Uncharacterized protein n=1 Tax=Hyalomma asiaticum TaxID=266040 RepID=A0ACB7TRD7_HYAAI|nr:hypothetical protein HPB50_026096 [Hyalomma asiaticum]
MSMVLSHRAPACRCPSMLRASTTQGSQRSRAIILTIMSCGATPSRGHTPTLRRGKVDLDKSAVHVAFRPTIPHCSMATLIGLAIRVKLLRSLPPTFKVDIRILPGTHVSESAINKQLDDKERVAAALENSHLLQVVNGCLLTH